MKLEYSEFLNKDGDVEFTDENIALLYKYNHAILKSYLHDIYLNDADIDDIIQNAVIRCCEKIKEFDATQPAPLGGRLCFVARGELTKHLKRIKCRHEVLLPPNDTGIYADVATKMGATCDNESLSYDFILSEYIDAKYNDLVHERLKEILRADNKYIKGKLKAKLKADILAGKFKDETDG